MNYTKRFQELSAKFICGRDMLIEESAINVKFCSFISNNVQHLSEKQSATWLTNDLISENEVFEYPVFLPPNKQKSDKAILLLHGLNERSWTKYLPWAEYLCKHTGKAVILFPIAYHLNRSPQSWTNPKLLHQVLELRRKLFGKDRSLSFANVALSERLSNNPGRFYDAGKQSFDDIVDLLTLVKSGAHPLFTEDAHVDVFAYSIGALLSQVLFLANPSSLFSGSRLFLFCGGSVFNRMFGESRSIMDKISFERLFSFYQKEEWISDAKMVKSDPAKKAFSSMIASYINKNEREDSFCQMRNRLGGISFALDKVIPYQGVVEALGHNCAAKRIQLSDFPYDYSHENPFPVFQDKMQTEVNRAFTQVFRRSVDFFCQ